MSIGTKVRIMRGSHKGQAGTIAGQCKLTGRLIIRTQNNIPVWVSAKSVREA